MIREATAQDITAIVAMGRDFNAASGTPAAYDDAQAAQVAAGLINGAHGVILVSDGGMIGGALAPAYFNSAWIMAVELFWWARDRRGLHLLRAFEQWAKDKGADEVRMTTLGAIKGPEKILERRGYAPCEVSYQKVL
ncbi:MAG: hypothetical protein EBT13_13235 [Rhodobacteraceae bacterium]|nr:hypothetical protein [Paracoccaceae bacterium]